MGVGVGLTDAVFGLVVDSYAEASVADELWWRVLSTFHERASVWCRTYSINLLLLALQLLGNLIHPLQVFQIALHPMHLARVPPFLQLLHCLFGMLFLHAKEEDLFSIMLEQVGYDAETNACTTTGHNEDLSPSSAEMLKPTAIEKIYLARNIGDVGVGVKLVACDE